jgi:hypothetical protein
MNAKTKKTVMEAKSTNKKTFQLTENGQQAGELIYENLFRMKAQIKLANSELYDVNPVSIFGTSITITKNGTEVANLKMNWSGQIVSCFQDGREFVLRGTGPFHSKYVLEDKNEEKLIQFDPDFNWRIFNYNYNITYEKPPQDILLVLLGVYASNYFIASMSGVFGGMV